MHVSWRRQWHPTLVPLPGKSHGWRSLVGCSPWGRWESDTTERLHFPFSLSCIGEGNGNPLQCSCLENPRDGGAWWAVIYGVPQSQTWLKWLSSACFWLYIKIEVTQTYDNFTVLLNQSAIYLSKKKWWVYLKKVLNGWFDHNDTSFLYVAKVWVSEIPKEHFMQRWAR